MKHLLKHFKDLSIHPKNAAELKGLILQLAVQGKLTANWRLENPDVESASVLLEHIQAEKAQLVKDKKIKKEKPLPEITDTEIPFNLPLTWSWCRLSELTELITKGSSPKWQGVQYVEEGEGVLFVTSENVGSYNLLWKKKKYVDWKFNEIEPRSILKRNDLLMNIVGASIGRTAIYDIDDLANINQAVTIIRVLQKVSYEYFLHFFNSPVCISYMYDKQVDNARPNLSMGNISKFLIPFPPLEEQKAIVSTVNTLFAEVEQLEALTQERIQLKEDFATSALQQLTNSQSINGEWAFLQQHFPTFFTEVPNIKKLRESILQLAVQGKLTTHWRKDNPDTEDALVLLERIKAEKAQLVKDKKIKKEKPLPEITTDEIPYELPEGWVWCRLGSYAHYGALQKCENKDAVENTWVLELEDVEKGTSKILKKVRFLERDFKSTKSVFYRGDVVYGKLRPYLDKVIVADEDGVCTTEMIPIKSFGGSDSEYLRLFMKSPLFIEYANSSVHGMRMPRMGTDVAKNAVLSIPPQEEQQAIVEKVNTLMALCDQLEQAIQNSKATQEDWMKSSLREVFTESSANKKTKNYQIDGGLSMVAEP